jgi:hypothetical protein
MSTTTTAVPSLYPYYGIELALRTLIQCTLEAQQHDRFKSYLQRGDYLAIIKEFCTIRVAGPRMAGHTTAMLKCAKDFEHPALITYNVSMAEDLKKRNKEAKLLSNAVWASQNNFNSILRGHVFDAMFVDMASFVSKTKLDEIAVLASCSAGYRFGANKNFLLIYLQ